MKKFTLPQVKNPSELPARSALEEVLRDGARKLLQEAIENEVLEYVQKFKEVKDEMNNRLVTRNGHLPARDILTGIGPINVRQPESGINETEKLSQALCFQNTNEKQKALSA